MDAKAFDKSKVPSRHVTERLSRAEHRSYDCAMRLTEKQVHKPFALSAMVGLAGCDKSLPGAMMSMLRLNMPAVLTYGRSILPGKFKGRDVTVLDVIENGDIISIEAEKSMLDLEISKAEFVRRRKAWPLPANLYQIGALRRYADQAGPARKGAVTHAGRTAEVVCYAEI
jgi:dihydroxyacid dehydratase/phosphogluconate dehydratase